MSAPIIEFDPPYDIHLLRGQSLQIINSAASLLTLDGISSHRYVDSNPNISYNFWTSFAEDKAADFGITLDNPAQNTPGSDRKPDWRITLAATEPAEERNRIRNFHLFADVENRADHSSNWTAVRIHIHNALAAVWITPNPLTVNLGITYQSRLYCRFDDDVVAELSTWGGYTITNRPTISWNSPTPDLIINQDAGDFRPQNITGTHTINVTVAYNATTLQDTAQLIVSNQLTADSMLRAELVTTGGCPGFARLNEVPNVLFVSEGFTDQAPFDHADDFDHMVNNYVSDLVSKKITSPFNLLKGSINFWKVFVPSVESGATYLGDLWVEPKKDATTPAELTGQLIPYIDDPETKLVSDWGVEHLIYWVGLPTRAEHDSTDQGVLDRLFVKWAATTNLRPEDINQLKTNLSLVKQWQRYGERRLPDGKDTAFGVVVKDNTTAKEWDDFNLISLDGKRIQRSDLDAFLGNLRDQDNNLIGPVFIQTPTQTQPRGKDFDTIILLTAIRRGRSRNADGYMFTVLGDQDTETLTGDLATLRVQIAPTKVPKKLSINAKATTTHELCHSFGLADEYGEWAPKRFDTKPVDDPLVSNWSFANYTKAASVGDWSSNVQARDDLAIPVSTGGSQIQPYKIKWRYHRIQKCGLVTAIALTGSQIVLTLQSGQAAQFTANKPVFLRKRRRNEQIYIIFLTANGRHSSLAAIVTPNSIPAEFEDEVEITHIDGATDSVTLSRDGDTLIVQVERGQAASLQPGPGFSVRTESRHGPVVTLFRTEGAVHGGPDIITKTISPELTVASIDQANNQLTLTIPTGVTLPDYVSTVNANEAMIVYEPVAMPDAQRSADYPYAEIISQKVLNYLLVNPYPFNAENQREVIDNSPDKTHIPSSLVPCCKTREKEIIGLYSGGNQYHGGVYHPSASCMMRKHLIKGEYTDLCAVCRYTLINQIDPTKHGDFDADYMKRNIYPD